MSDVRNRILATYVESGVSVFTGEPFCQQVVTFRREDGSEDQARGQLDPEDARQAGRQMMEAAEAAVHDAAFVRWLRERMDVDSERAVQALADLRRLRADYDRQVDIPPEES